MVVTGVVFVGAFVLSSAGFGQAEELVELAGLLQRVAVIAGFGWLTLRAVQLLSRGPCKIPRRMPTYLRGVVAEGGHVRLRLVLSGGTRGSTYRRRSLHRTSALADHGVEWIGKHAPRATIQAADTSKVASLPEILFYEAHVSLVVQPMPDGYRLARKATVREGDHRGSANRLILPAAHHALGINPARTYRAPRRGVAG